MLTERELTLKSVAYRRAILTNIKQVNAGHTGGSLSCIDILNVLYNRVMNVSPQSFTDPDRDRYVHSKGHSVEALYTVLADVGFFPPEDLTTKESYQSHYVGHPTRKINGVEQNTGALGHGLAFGVGLALAAKQDGRHYRVFVLVGDGELTEGSNWEALMAAAHYKLDNLIIIVDRNTLQITGRTKDVMALEPLEAKFRAFGCAVEAVNGNDITALVQTFDALPFHKDQPNLVLARTVKGKGISFMEDVASWHHHVPNDDEYTLALQELDVAEQQLRGLPV